MEELSGETSESTTQIEPRTEPRIVYPLGQCTICWTRTWITNKKRHLDTRKHKDVL